MSTTAKEPTAFERIVDNLAGQVERMADYFRWAAGHGEYEDRLELQQSLQEQRGQRVCAGHETIRILHQLVACAIQPTHQAAAAADVEKLAGLIREFHGWAPTLWEPLPLTVTDIPGRPDVLQAFPAKGRDQAVERMWTVGYNLWLRLGQFRDRYAAYLKDDTQDLSTTPAEPPSPAAQPSTGPKGDEAPIAEANDLNDSQLAVIDELLTAMATDREARANSFNTAAAAGISRSAVKKATTALEKRGYVETGTGAAGGAWLTPKGLSLAAERAERRSVNGTIGEGPLRP